MEKERNIYEELVLASQRSVLLKGNKMKKKRDEGGEILIENW